MVAVGDAASGSPTERQMAGLMASWQPNLLTYLGDVYDRGSPYEFDNWYGDPSGIGQFRSITNPAIGNHEPLTAGGAGYFEYWDNIPHYYSYDVAGWHVVTLDSTDVVAGAEVVRVLGVAEADRDARSVSFARFFGSAVFSASRWWLFFSCHRCPWPCSCSAVARASTPRAWLPLSSGPSRHAIATDGTPTAAAATATTAIFRWCVFVVRCLLMRDPHSVVAARPPPCPADSGRSDARTAEALVGRHS